MDDLRSVSFRESQRISCDTAKQCSGREITFESLQVANLAALEYFSFAS
jgi:hypothetical protein